MYLVVHFAVKGVCVLTDAAGRRRDEEQLARDVVLEDVPRGAGLVGLTQALGLEAAGAGVGAEELGGRGHAGAALLAGARLDVDAVDGLEERLRHALRDEPDGARELAELVNGQDAVAHEVGLCRGEVGEHETGAVAEDHAVAEVDGLEVLRLAGRRRDGHLFGADEGVDGGRLAHIGVADQAYLELLTGF